MRNANGLCVSGSQTHAVQFSLNVPEARMNGLVAGKGPHLARGCLVLLIASYLESKWRYFAYLKKNLNLLVYN